MRYWFISRNLNYYNPISKTTVFRYGDTWKIAKYNRFFGIFNHKQQAIDETFKLWLEEYKIIELWFRLKHELQIIKDRISINTQ